LEATLNYIGRREDADLSRIMAFGVSGGGAAVVALSTRNIPGLQVVVNVSGGFALVGCGKNSDRLVAALPTLITLSARYGRYFHARARAARE
jgi:hypothetical protein